MKIDPIHDLMSWEDPYQLGKKKIFVSHFMAKFSWGGRTESIFLQIFLHGENGTVMEIQSKTKEFCPNIKKKLVGWRV